jgi:peptidoglycan hydrolase-like protein with peptidoglycan-binding domain
MRKNLNEDLKRIHRLIYGKSLIKEDALDKIVSKPNPEKIDEPNKADLVSTNVDDFLNTLKGINKTFEEQPYGKMVYQKEIETVQIALSISMEPNNPLPKHGVDGFFGPETAKAVNQYKEENGINDDDVQSSDVNELLNEEVIPGIDEMVWNKMPWGIDAGNRVDHIYWDGHDTHIHFGFTKPETAVAVIKKAQELGLRASENPYTTGVDQTVHKKKSFHYREFGSTLDNKVLGKGLDVSGDSTKMEELFNWVATTIGSGSNLPLVSLVGLMSVGGNGNNDDTQPKPTQEPTQEPTTDVIVNKTVSKVGKETITPELAQSLYNNIKDKVTPEILDGYVDKIQKQITSPQEIRDMVNVIINYIEGGYYHPNMKEKNPQKFKLFGSSTETLFGMDRYAGDWEKTSAGQEFFNIIDGENASDNWSYNYKLEDNPSLSKKLKDLSADMINQRFQENKKRYFSKEALDVVNSDAGLTFNFLYASYNGPLWFQKFASEINDEVASGNTNPKSLLKIAIDTRKNWTSDKPHVTTLIRRTGDKVMGALQKFFRDYDQTNLV